MKKYIMSLDQGTTSSRCIIFKKDGSIASMVQREFPQIFPKEGWVEHNPMAIWSTQIAACTEALMQIGGNWDEISGIGITNQRETVIVWERATGKPIYNAIVWQCRRTTDTCEELEKAGLACTGIHPESDLVDIVEVPACDWYVGVIYEPQYSSTVLHPSPIVMDFVKNVIARKG